MESPLDYRGDHHQQESTTRCTGRRPFGEYGQCLPFERQRRREIPEFRPLVRANGFLNLVVV